ncbi:MAG: protein-disulfide reductase DsbD family protein [Caulobacter sp.]|nr:protein-disulfide reductase DsbD family protein [Caulobacter sp.]
MRLTTLLAALFALFAAPALAAPVDTGHIQAELVAQEAAVPGGTVYVALRQNIDKGWHTYWRNPGDSGQPPQITWTLPAGWKTGDFVWPTPSRQPIGPLMNYGYSGDILLPTPIEVPITAKPGETVRIGAAVTILVCADICVPEDAVLTLDLPVTAGPPRPDPVWGPRIAKVLAAAPKLAGLTATFQVAGPKLTLAVAGTPLEGADFAGAWFFPFSGTAIEHAKPQAIERGPRGLTLTLPAGFDFTQAKAPATLAGVLALPGGAYEISATAGPPPKGAAGLGPPPGAAGGKALGLPAALLFALLGGLILNLMPCVFPVLSMKAAALAGHAHETRAARHQGLAYLAGVLATFLALAGAVIALKAAGAAIGWGFQLQSPAAVAALAGVMLLVAMNLSGVFQVGGALQGVGGGLADGKEGLAGSFMTGVLAVVVAAPCTAPFMGPAMGFALTQGAAVSLLIFAALGLGLALPFVALSFAPPLLRLMPRPGAWMETLRNVLAFPMYGTAAWLVWVLAQQTAPAGLALGLAAAVVAAFGAWLFGHAQRRETAPVTRGLAALAILAAAGLIYGLTLVPPPTPVAGAGKASSAAQLSSEPWSPERVAALRAEGRPILVNFTAAWCVTCQVNEQVALSTATVARALQSSGAVYLKADWTNRDAAIARALAEHGRAGVPLYLVYGSDGSPPVILPQLLTEGLVAEALAKAAVPPIGG